MSAKVQEHVKGARACLNLLWFNHCLLSLFVNDLVCPPNNLEIRKQLYSKLVKRQLRGSWGEFQICSCAVTVIVIMSQLLEMN